MSAKPLHLLTTRDDLTEAYLKALAAAVGGTVESLRDLYLNPDSPWMERGMREHPYYVWFEKGWQAKS